MIELSAKQEEIASFDKGPLLVLASAGSGKTRVLTERIKRLITKTKRKVLAITFTNKASEEIKERLKDTDNIQEKAFIGTFHSFCSYVLEKHGNAIGYKELPQIFSEDNDKLKLIEEVIFQIPSIKEVYLSKDEKGRNDFKRNALDLISSIKRNVILDSELKEKVKSSTDIILYLNYRNKMKSLNAIDFDDLLYLVYQLFISYPNISALYRRNFEYICIDEAQDLNKAQYMVLKALASNENTNVMLVGDPKQSIFGFNGSHSSYMTEMFRKDYYPTIIELTENYRSSKKVLEYANALIPNSSEVTDEMLKGICEVTSYDSPQSEASAVVSKIQEFLQKRTLPDIEDIITPSKIAVIARNKYVLLPIETELKTQNIPFFYKNNVKCVDFESTSGIIFSLALQVKINSYDMLHLEELNHIIGTSDSKKLEDLLDSCSNEFYKLILDKTISLKDDGSNFKSNITNILTYIKNNTADLEENKKEEFILAYSDFTSILDNWHKYAISTNNKSLAAFHNSMALGQTANTVEKDGVVLSTVHTMKGQESDIVFLIGMDDLTFPDYRAIQKGGFELEQEKNDLYVAVTRAKRYLYISYPITRTMPWGGIYRRRKSSLLPRLSAEDLDSVN